MNQFGRDALSRFVQGELSVPELSRMLEGSVSLNFTNPGERIVKIAPGSNLAAVEFSRDNIANAIRRFLRFETESDDLSEWAAVIRMLDSYFNLDPRDPDPDTVWDIVDRLMNSGVAGDLDREQAEALLRVLQLEP